LPAFGPLLAFRRTIADWQAGQLMLVVAATGVEI